VLLFLFLLLHCQRWGIDMSIEAMKQALEALEESGLRWTNIVEAITSLRQAIEEAEKPCKYCHGTGDVHDQTGEWRGVCVCEAGKAEKHEVSQEPVGYVSWSYEAVWNGKPPKAESNLYTHPQPKREPPTPLEVKDVLRATGLLTNSQAWDVAEEVMKLLAAHGIKE
jgi:hypothetical protein